ncbi:MAG: dihydropteroate synthase [Lachnospiraceae bacterium]|nr:dihydropteroate synthase [Lachnospiraceae bacterium]
MKIGNREFEIGAHTYLMGILNVTPDSFSDGGKWNQQDAALFHVEEMIRDGADIIDIGGESTRPGYGAILPDEEELSRVLPVIEAVRKRFDIPISIDTYKGGVAKVALEAGADLVNDIWGCKYDRKMAGVIAEAGAACCLMHNRKEPVYENYLEEVKADLSKSVALAREAGVEENRILLDPGMGFGKTYEQNLILMNHLEVLGDLGYPVLLGTSRKSMIGLTLDLPVTDRLEGTLATTVMGVIKGCAFVRVHDVKENARAIKMTEAILRA